MNAVVSYRCTVFISTARFFVILLLLIIAKSLSSVALFTGGLQGCCQPAFSNGN